MKAQVAAAGTGLLAGVSIARRGIAQAWASAEVRRTYLQLVLVLLAFATVLDAAGIWAVVQWTRVGDDSV